MKQKQCTHCGSITHSQPQDFNHDTGFGHCYDCLNKQSWYRKDSFNLDDNCTMTIYHSLPIYEDDSHGKVIEIIKADKVLYHATHHSQLPDIKQKLINKFILHV
jgi:hypothetical protein